MWNKRTSRPIAKRHPVTRPQRKEEPTPSALAKHLFKSLAVTLATALLSLLLLSTVAYLSEDPSTLLLPFGLIAAALTALVGGFTSVRLHKKSALLCGLCNGCAMMAIMLVISLFFRSAASMHSPLLSCLLHAGYLLLSVLGAFAALPRTAHAAGKHRVRRR